MISLVRNKERLNLSFLYDLIKDFNDFKLNNKQFKEKITKEAIYIHKHINSFIIRNFDKEIGRLPTICYIKELLKKDINDIYSEILEQYKDIINSDLNKLEEETLLQEIEIRMDSILDPLNPDELYNYYKRSRGHMKIYQKIRNINYKDEFEIEVIKLDKINNFLNTLSEEEIKLIDLLNHYMKDYHKFKERIYYCYIKMYEEGLDFNKFSDLEDFKNMEAGLQAIYFGYKYSMKIFFIDLYEEYFNLFEKIDIIVNKDKVYSSLSNYSLLDNYIHIRKQYKL